MARKRLISPQFFQNADLYDAEQESGLPIRVAYAGLWTVADRRGIFPWTRNLKPAILPYDACDILDALMVLERHGFIRSYTVGERTFGIIPTFAQHQTFHHAEKENPNLPPPPAERVPETEAGPRPALVSPETRPTVAVTGTATVAATAPTTTALPVTRKQRASRSMTGDGKQQWLAPYAELWERINGAGSCDHGHLAREIQRLLKAGWEEDEILRRLEWYMRNKGSEATLQREELERRYFLPNPTLFRKRFAFFDPNTPAEGGAVEEEWAKRAEAAWVASVGLVSSFRIREDLRRFVALYSCEKLAADAVETAITNYVDTCRRRDQRPAWRDFANNIIGHLPPAMKPQAQVAA